jgi:two-component system invasion response regulator UvrY
MATRVFIVDDHELMRQGLRSVLDHHGGFKISGEAGSFKEFVALFGKSATQVLVLDISLPDRNGLEILKYVRDNHPSTRVLVLSMHPEERFAIRALRSGATGYLNKQAAAQELVAAIERVKSGEIYVSREVTGELIRELEGKRAKTPHDELKDTEFEVLRMIATGKTAKQIGKEMGLSMNTITTYRSRILEKLKLKTTADLVRYAMDHHLVD